MKLSPLFHLSQILIMYLMIITSTAQAQNSEVCIDISGPWGVLETVTVTCSAEGESETFNENASGDITIHQTGCDIYYIVPGINVIRRGTLIHNSVKFSGTLVSFSPSVTVNENIINSAGVLKDQNLINMTGNGHASGTFNAESSVSCSGSTVATFNRKHPNLIPIVQLILDTDEW